MREPLANEVAPSVRKRALSDQRGAIYVETLIAFLPVFAFFLGTLQLADASVAQLVVQHASTTAARAAVVVLPDDGAYYNDRENADLHKFKGARRLDVERAADLVLRANPRLHANGANVSLNQADYAERDDLIATVRVRYHCLIPALCGTGIDLDAESKLVYQGAKFVYESNTGLIDNAFSQARNDTQRSMDDPTDPRSYEREGNPLFPEDDRASTRPPESGQPDTTAGNPSQQDVTDPSRFDDHANVPRGPPSVATTQPAATRPAVEVANQPAGAKPSSVDSTPSAVAAKPPPAGTKPNVDPTSPTVAAKPPALAAKPPAVAAKPPAVAANPPVLAANPPAVAANPPTVAANAPVLAANPPAVAANPPVLAANPPAVAANPPSTGAAPPSSATSPATIATRPAVDLTKPQQTPSTGAVAAKPPVDLTKKPPPVDLAKPNDRAPPAPVATPTLSPEMIEALNNDFGCFVAGTAILTPFGERAIETIAAGDRVYAYDEQQRKNVIGTVSRTFGRETHAIVDLTVRLEASDRDELLSGTVDHPFYVPALADYVAMGRLTPGTELLTFDGRRAEVVSLQLRRGRFDVFNFAVDGEHNYYVLGSSDPPAAILVHNETNPCQAPPPSNDPPYDGRAIRDYFEATYGAGNVSSSTVPPRSGPNVRLAGTRHPNGVVFDEKGYPIFDDVMVTEVRISDAHVATNNDASQMRAATRQLRDLVRNDPILRSQFDAAQLRAIRGGRAKIPGFTWQHHQDIGRMQLVPEEIHASVPHIGGAAMWQGR
jgi:hypothetical protein